MPLTLLVPPQKNKSCRREEESGKICIRVELPNGIVRELGSFNGSDQGARIKSKIHDLEGLKPNLIRLFIGGKELRDNMRLSSSRSIKSKGVHDDDDDDQEERARVSFRCLGGMDETYVHSSLLEPFGFETNLRIFFSSSQPGHRLPSPPHLRPKCKLSHPLQATMGSRKPRVIRGTDYLATMHQKRRSLRPWRDRLQKNPPP